MEAAIIFGFISFAKPPDGLSGAGIHVHLLDTTYADAPSVKLAQQDMHGDQVMMTKRGIGYRLPEVHLSNHRQYEVWVHVDMDLSGDITAGDYLSTQAHILPAISGKIQVPIRVERI